MTDLNIPEVKDIKSRPRKIDGAAHYSLTLPQELKTLLELEAKKRGTTMAMLCRTMLAEGLGAEPYTQGVADACALMRGAVGEKRFRLGSIATLMRGGYEAVGEAVARDIELELLT
jgi:uncharacterized protein (DUF2164 family)|tara:strand:- start:7160 stop:7507 length:348 start_codon:yes stop_codon:yes gene_type:complete